MPAMSRSVSTRFRGDAAEATAAHVALLDRVGGTIVSGDVGGTATVALSSGSVILAVGPVADGADASGGFLELTAVRTASLRDDQWLRVIDAVRRVPFTTTEHADIAATMPLTAGLPKDVAGRPLQDLSAIFTIHHMRDFVVMVRTAAELGLDPADITVIDKEYAYELSTRVDATLGELGFKVERYSDLPAAVGRHLSRARGKHQRTIVLDDGGYVFPMLYEHHRPSLQEVVGLIEQTTSGIWRLRPYDTLPMPVFSVAESRLKATIESYGVTDAAFRNTRRLLPDVMFEGRDAVVVGLGRLGMELVPLLRNRRMRVTAHDTDPLPLLELAQRGFSTGSDLVEILGNIRPVVVFGCSGGRDRPSLTRKHFEALNRDCYVVSLTSRDWEFDLPALRSLAVTKQSRGRVGTTYVLPSGVAVTAVADGHPVNFHYAESMPNEYSDLVLASMLVGACTLADPACTFAPGHNVAATNRVLSECGILQRFRDLYE